ncbi:peroxidase-related enzyme (plasmid) [Streptomyces sp. NBC_00846]|uniref:carboxymuconolactone decarboxylase family protein n=1 Tax=Streptomyces sp. NBC_00846 TaxID=2975849 RepID=UPI002F90C1B8|nr:peroxidase-related enzyme [Streptomyces sp. NBC_00846]
MPHITISNDEPGIRGLMAHRPDTAAPLNHLANVLLREPASLSRGERELIAAYVSHLNSTLFCAGTHGAAAAAQLDGGRDTVRAVCAGPDSAPVTPRLRALLRIAAEVRQHARPVSDDAVAAARAEGAEDSDIHDTVLIAAAFCMYNRYVSCLSTDVPAEEGYYDGAAHRIVGQGYGTGLHQDHAPDMSVGTSVPASGG